jgi:hypothetical protein
MGRPRVRRPLPPREVVVSRRSRLIRAASRRCGRIARRYEGLTLAWIGACQSIEQLIAIPTVRRVRRW